MAGIILNQALAGYTRSAGFDDLTRLHCSTAESEALVTLRAALIRRWPNGDFDHAEGFIELRSRLRWYLYDYLLRRVVNERPGLPVLRDAMFAIDLGV